MEINANDFIKISYRGGVSVYFHRDLASHFHRKFGHKNRTRQFPYFKNLVEFLRQNPTIKVFFTEAAEAKSYMSDKLGLLVNIDAYIEFCERIETKTEGRAQAFFGQHIDSSVLLSPEVKKEIIASSSESEIIERISNFDEVERAELTEKLKERGLIILPNVDIRDLPDDVFSFQLKSAVSNASKRQIILSTYKYAQIETLKRHCAFLRRSLDKNEMFIQNWIDAKIDSNGSPADLSEVELNRVKKSRCLIFGLEFINHKREGSASQKRFDILTRTSEGRNEYVLIELKSPSGSVFTVDEEVNENGGKSTSYSFSGDIARAIPQITHYKGLLKEATQTEWQRYGLVKGEVVKSIILVGTRVGDSVWNEHFSSLKHGLSSSLEIMTHTDLIDKLEATIKNLEENL